MSIPSRTGRPTRPHRSRQSPAARPTVPPATVRTADFTFGANEPEATFECRLDSESSDDWAPCSSPQSYTGLADGNHTFEVRSTDLGGNAEAAGASRSWQVDATALVVDLSGPSGAAATDSATITFSADDANATFECRPDSTDEGDWAACASPVELTVLAQEHIASRCEPPIRPATSAGSPPGMDR